MAEFGEIKSVKWRDWLKGSACSVGSALLHKLPENCDFVTRKPSDSSVQLRWRHLNTTPAELGQQWVHHHGVEGAKKMPRNFKLAQILQVDRDELLKAWAAEQGGDYSNYCKPAVTYRLGTTVMMGTTPDDRILFEEESDYQVAMGLGEGALDAGVGIYSFDRKVYRGLEKGVLAGLVMPIAELPPHIPLV